MTLGAVGSPRRTDPQQRRYPRRVTSPADKLPIKMLNDRLLVRIGRDDGERRSSGGILIPATAQMSKRLIWAEVVALGQNVRVAEVGELPVDEGTQLTILVEIVAGPRVAVDQPRLCGFGRVVA